MQRCTCRFIVGAYETHFHMRCPDATLHLQMIVGAYETRLQDAAAEAADLRQALTSLQQEHRTLENRQAAQMQRIAAASNLVSLRKQITVTQHCAYETCLQDAV